MSETLQVMAKRLAGENHILQTELTRLRDLEPLCEEINHAVWPDPDAGHDTAEAPAAIDTMRRELTRLRDAPEYRICKHDENWNGNTSNIDYYRVECLKWVQMAGQFTSFEEAQGYADTIEQTALAHAVTNRKQAAELKALRDALPKCWRLNEKGERVQDVVVVPDMEVWFWSKQFSAEPYELHVDGIGRSSALRSKNGIWYSSADCSNSREAAEAARKEGEGKP